MNTEIYQSIPFFTQLLQRGGRIITDIKNSGIIDAKVKGQFQSGDLDYVTAADLAVRDFYHQQMEENFPNWAVILEDGVEKLTAKELKKDVVVFFDPVDGTKLLQENKPGSSTMAAVAVRNDWGYVPVLGLIQIVEGSFLLGYADETYTDNTSRPITSKKQLTIGRSAIDRSGLLGKACEALQYDVELIRGIGPQTQAILEGKTDIFIYDPPGPSLWDVYPALPIVKAHGGYVCNWKGEEPAYDGSTNKYGGMVAVMPNVNLQEVLDKLARISLT